jgi:hypothetical protein
MGRCLTGLQPAPHGFAAQAQCAGNAQDRQA